MKGIFENLLMRRAMVDVARGNIFHKARGVALITMLVVIVVLTVVVPIAIDFLLDTDTSGWPTQLVTIWDNLPLFVGIVALLVIVGFMARNRQGSGV